MNAREPLQVEVDRGGSGVSFDGDAEGRVQVRHGTGRTAARLRDLRARPARRRRRRARRRRRRGSRPETSSCRSPARPIQGSPDQVFAKFVEAVKAAAPGPFPIVYERDGKTATVTVAPRQESDGVWKVGVQVGGDLPEVIERFPVRQAFVEGFRRVETDFRMTLSVLGRLFRGKASMKTMSGPLDIAKFSGQEARKGAVPLLAFMAAISLQLGIFNLLPIPVLDGGHLFLLGVEGIARRDFSLRVKERILQVGFVMILALLAVVLYNDLAKNLPTGWWPF